MVTFSGEIYVHSVQTQLCIAYYAENIAKCFICALKALYATLHQFINFNCMYIMHITLAIHYFTTIAFKLIVFN